MWFISNLFPSHALARQPSWLYGSNTREKKAETVLMLVQNEIIKLKTAKVVYLRQYEKPINMNGQPNQ